MNTLITRGILRCLLNMAGAIRGRQCASDYLSIMDISAESRRNLQRSIQQAKRPHNKLPNQQTGRRPGQPVPRPGCSVDSTLLGRG